jgi:energy-coupling factor transporter transmembrane protein EcfT
VVGTIILGFVVMLVGWLFCWFIFIAAKAGLEFVRVIIKIEDNTMGSR